MWQDRARRQGGVIRRDQLRAGGLSNRQIDTLLARGDLRRARPRSVLAVAGAPSTQEGAWWTALLATRGVLSHQKRGPQLGPAGARGLRRELTGATAESERIVHRLLRDAGLAGWRPNVWFRINGHEYEIDVAFADALLAVEVDGWAHHVNVDRFRADRRKQNALTLAGWTVIRFTWADLTERPDYVIRTICAGLTRDFGYSATSTGVE